MKIRVCLVMFTSLLLTGCINTDGLSANSYSAAQAKQIQHISYGTITHLRQVAIQAGNEHNPLGAIGGAVVGGLLGNTVGGGSGKKLATAAGAIAGGIGGQKLQSSLNQSAGLEMEIRKEDGSSIIVVQKQGKTPFAIGQRVAIISSGNQVTVAPR